MPDLPIAPGRVWVVLSQQGNIVHAQPHEPHPADARMWASHGATVAEYVPAPMTAPEPPDRPLAPCFYCCCSPCTCEGGS
jgi:hypothetical protein